MSILKKLGVIAAPLLLVLGLSACHSKDPQTVCRSHIPDQEITLTHWGYTDGDYVSCRGKYFGGSYVCWEVNISTHDTRNTQVCPMPA